MRSVSLNISTQRLKINEEIRDNNLRVIGEDGHQYGIISKEEALSIARNDGFDLVLVNPNAEPPVCRILDYGKYLYKQTKKEKEAKKKQHVVKVKEVKLRPAIDEHDYEVKLHNAMKFLEKGNKVKVTLMFRGREMAHKDKGFTLIDRFSEALVESKYGVIEAAVKEVGRTITMVVAPVRH